MIVCEKIKRMNISIEKEVKKIINNFLNIDLKTIFLDNRDKDVDKKTKNKNDWEKNGYKKNTKNKRRFFTMKSSNYEDITGTITYDNVKLLEMTLMLKTEEISLENLFKILKINNSIIDTIRTYYDFIKGSANRTIYKNPEISGYIYLIFKIEKSELTLKSIKTIESHTGIQNFQQNNINPLNVGHFVYTTCSSYMIGDAMRRLIGLYPRYTDYDLEIELINENTIKSINTKKLKEIQESHKDFPDLLEYFRNNKLHELTNLISMINL